MSEFGVLSQSVTSLSFTSNASITLPDASIVGNGYSATVQISGNCLSVQFIPIGSQTINSHSGTFVFSRGNIPSSSAMTLSLVVSGGNWTFSTTAQNPVQALPSPTNSGALVFENASGTGISTDQYLSYNGSTLRLNVVDNYGALHVLGRDGGEASIAIQPDNVSDGSAGQWVFYTGSGGGGNLNIYASGTGTVVTVNQNGDVVCEGYCKGDNFYPLQQSTTTAPGTALGTDASISLSSSYSDMGGVVTLTSGTGPSTGVLATMTINSSPGFMGPVSVVLTPADSTTAGVMSHIYASVITNGWTISTSSALSASTSYNFNFMVIVSST